MKLREGNVFTPVCQSFCPQGACLGGRVSTFGSGGCTPPGHKHTHTPTHPLGTHTSWAPLKHPLAPPGHTYPPTDTPTLVEMAIEAGGTHHTGMHSCSQWLHFKLQRTKIKVLRNLDIFLNKDVRGKPLFNNNTHHLLSSR